MGKTWREIAAPIIDKVLRESKGLEGHTKLNKTMQNENSLDMDWSDWSWVNK